MPTYGDPGWSQDDICREHEVVEQALGEEVERLDA